MKKAIFWLGVMLTVALISAACAPAAAPAPSPAPAPQAAPAAPALSPEEAAWQKVVESGRKEGRLVVYSFGFVGDLGVATTKTIKEKYGISVEFVTGRTPVLVERIRTEMRAKQAVASLMEGSAPRLMVMKEEGLTLSMGPLPALREKDKFNIDLFLLDPDMPIFDISAITIAVNSKLVSPPEEPRSWFDLLDPKWTGKILMADPTQANLGYMGYVGLINHGVLKADYFARLAEQRPRFVAGGPADIMLALARGDGVVTPEASGRGARPVIQAGGPVKFVTPKEGFHMSPSPIVLVKNAPHPNAGRVFVNWLLSAEGARLQAQIGQTSSIRKDVPDFTAPAAQVDIAKGFVLGRKDLEDVEKAWREQALAKILKK